MIAAPGAPPATAMSADSWPAGTSALAGTAATAGSLLSSAMVVGSTWVALMVAVSVPVPPAATGRLGGSGVGALAWPRG